MPARGKIATLSADMQRRFEAKCIELGFSRYRELSEWAATQGISIHYSTASRWGKQLERRISQIDASTRAAAALMESNPDAEGNLAAATLKAAQSRLFDLTMAAGAEELSVKDLTATLKAAAEGARASVVIQRERERVVAAVRDVVDREERCQNSPADLAAALRAALATV